MVAPVARLPVVQTLSRLDSLLQEGAQGMSRAQGRRQRQPRAEEIKPGTPEGRELGLSDRVQGHPSPIPGGRPHLSNAPAIRHTVPTPPSDPEVGMGNAHGVQPGSHTNAERADAERGPNTVHATMPRPKPHHLVERPQPIPVFVVQDAHNSVIRSAAPHAFTAPGNASDPTRICGRDGTRTEVMILNESTAQDVRIAQTPRDLTNGGGALLSHQTVPTSYLTIKTQDELWALSTSGTAATISVIQVFERNM